MNQKEVTITYASHMYNTDEKIDITAKGIWGNKNGVNFVRYNEENEGMAPTKTTLKFNKDYLKVSKLGTTKTEMYYEQGYTHKGLYHTFIGDYDMCIKTEEYTLEEMDNGFKIVTVYNLELDGNFITKCKVEITIK